MTAEEILKFIISDIMTAALISAFFLWVSNKKQDQAKKMEERSLQDLKDHLDLRLEIQTLELEKFILESKDAKELQ